MSAAQDSGNVIPFQGQLADQSGQPLTPTSPVSFVFRLYQTPVGGVALWEEAQSNISVNAGRFSVLLGSRNTLPAYTNFNATLYLGLTVDDGDPATTDVEMRPRQALVPVISASYAKEAETLHGYDWSVLFGTSDPASGTLLDSKIRDGSISAAKLQPASITSNQIAPQQITAGLIASGTINSNQIKSGAIDVSNLAKQIAEALNPPGTITAFGGATNRIPDGWLLCDGRAVSSAQYPDLFEAISTNWGAGLPGTSNDFHLPDLRGYFLRGASATTTNDPDRNLRTSLAPGGSVGNAVGSYQQDLFAAHDHGGGDHRHTIGNSSTLGNVEGVLHWGERGGSADQTGNVVRDSGVIIEIQGGSETRPKNAYVNYIIKY